MKHPKKIIDDSVVMSLIANGDQEAFELLFDREMMGLYKLAYTYLEDEGRAEDIVQEAFMRLWNNADLWEPKAQIRTWLSKIVRNLCVDHMRKIHIDSRKNISLLERSVTNYQEINSDELKIGYDQVYLKLAIKEAIFSLPERQREALALVYYSEYSGAEASEIMGLTVAALESLLARARRGLRKSLVEKKKELLVIANDGE